MTILRRYGETDFVSGLRAVAAIMVMMIHTGGFRDLGWLGANMTKVGGYGVQMFFVISGFSIAISYASSPSYTTYLIRRLARILPLYFAVILLALALMGSGLIEINRWAAYFGVPIDTYNIVMHFTLLSILDYRVANAIIGVEWSIPIEVFWYLVLPLFLHRIWGIKNALIFMTALILLAFATKIALDQLGSFRAARWFPTSYGPYFLMGVLCAAWRDKMGYWSGAVFWAGVALLWFALLAGLPYMRPVIGLATMLIILGYRGSGILTSKPLLYLGTISYSVYLLHVIVIQLLDLPDAWGKHWVLLVVLMVSVIASTVTYLAIEQPGMRIGAMLVKTNASRAANSEPVSVSRSISLQKNTFVKGRGPG
ncbi:MAG: acyltransferase [Pseudomonadota bacterium]